LVNQEFHGRFDFVSSQERNRKRVLKVLKDHPEGLTIKQIAKESGMTRQTSSKYVLALTFEGKVECREIGPAKLCYLKSVKK